MQRTRYSTEMVSNSFIWSQTFNTSPYCLHSTFPHPPPPHLQDHQSNSVRGLIETPLFIHVYTGGCWIYSQSAISKTPSLTYYLQYMRIPRHCICSCEVLSTPHSHSYTFLNITYSHAVLDLSSTSRIVSEESYKHKDGSSCCQQKQL